MSIIWFNDVCDCVIEYQIINNAPSFVSALKKCIIHQTFDGQELYNKVLEHNRSFNWKFGNAPTIEQQLSIKQDKQLERMRIEGLKK